MDAGSSTNLSASADAKAAGAPGDKVDDKNANKFNYALVKVTRKNLKIIQNYSTIRQL